MYPNPLLMGESATSCEFCDNVLEQRVHNLGWNKLIISKIYLQYNFWLLLFMI